MLPQFKTETKIAIPQAEKSAVLQKIGLDMTISISPTTNHKDI